jgi:cellulose synthase operon protein C
MIIPESDLQEVIKLHEKSLHLQAYKLAQAIAPLPHWEGAEARLLAANLAYNLGAVETSRRWTANVWRKNKTHPRALFYVATDILHRKGTLPALVFVRKYAAEFTADAKLRSWWYCLHAEIFARLRDFKAADGWHQKAMEIAPQESWVRVSKSFILELQDRYEEALEISRLAFEIDGGQRSSAYQTAHLLTLLERYDEALELLSDATERLENGWVVRQLADLQTELGMHREAYRSLEKLLELTPMREENLEQWIYGSLSDAAYLNGDLEQAIRFADISSTPFHLKIKERLENLDGTEKRVRLKLGFLRQHHLTCAPATLSNISRFWQKKAEHLELADEMCYEGTPAYKERIWANRNGWATREFTINWKNTAELIDRGVPFTIATIQPGNGHLQAIVGYDERRRTFLVRDPFFQRFDEYSADELLEDQKSSGPRGLALVPLEKAALLEGLELAESRQYDFQFAIDGALEDHDRERAVEALAAMEKEFPDHRLTWSARWALARYDANNQKLLEAVEKLLAQFPEDINLKLSYLSISNEFLSRPERLKKLEEFSKEKKTDPLLWQMFGYELGLDAHQHGRALRWLYKTLRTLPSTGLTYRFIADILWSQRRFEDALELYRFAASLNDKEEQFSYSYFLAARYLKKEEEALQFLRDRFERFGARSNLPVQSLFHALRELGRTVEAFAVLETALEKRPGDGELKLFAAGVKMRFGKKAEAEELLERAENQAPRGVWLKNAALIAEQRGELGRALDHWREVAGLEPTTYDTHENIAFLLSAIEGKKAAQEYLRKITRQFPFNVNLQKLRLAYLNEETTEAIAILRDLVRLNPEDAWSRRELARWLTFVKKYEPALESALKAVSIEPNDALNHWSLGTVRAATEKNAEAAQEFEKALTLSVDADYALAAWLNICRSNEEKTAVLRFMRGELARQVNFGAGIVAYREQAKRLLEPPALLAELKEFYEANEDQWFALSVVVRQLVDMHEFDEALVLAEKNTARFPLIFQVWHDLSTVHKLRGENEAEIDALRQTVSLNTNWSFGFQQLTEALQRAGRFEEAGDVVREALSRMPLDHFLHGYLAEIQWTLGEKEAALETARRAVGLEPEYDWAWRVIKNWSQELDQPNLAAALARELTVRKPKDVRAWLTYAQILDDGKFSQEQLDAAEEALKLEPNNLLAMAVKANSLADARRFDEALAVCQAVSADGYRHEQLRYVEAGIEATRGNYEESIRQLEELTKQAPDYYAAWERLAGIYREWGDKKREYLRVTRGMARLAPQEPTVFGYLGEAYMLNNQRAEAKHAFRQALSLSPDYGFAGGKLFDLFYEDGELEECRQLVESLRRFVHSESSLVREIVFYAKDGNWEKAAERWRELCLSEKADKPHFDYVLEKFGAMNPGKQAFVFETLRATAFENDANRLVGAYFIERCRKIKSDKECLEFLEKLPENQEIWVRATIRYLEILLDSDPQVLSRFIKQNYRKLKRNDDVWASTGYLLNASADHRTALEWFADWEQREKVESWMLWNYALVLRRFQKDAEAGRVHRAAVEMASDETVNLHLMMLGLDAVHAGDYVSASRHHAQVNPQVMEEWDRFFFFLLEKGLEIRALSTGGQTAEAAKVTENLVNDCLYTTGFWTDKIKAAAFERSLSAALALQEGFWLKTKLRLRVLKSKAGLI